MDEFSEKARPQIVLVIEDDPRVREFLVEVMRRSGYACECAASCAEGRRVFAAGQFACALIDLGLPDGTGLSLLDSFRETDPSLVSIVLTGDGSTDTIIETMRTGAFDYLVKPVDVVTLRAAIARAMAHHDVVCERAQLVRLLLEEREQLRARIEAATLDLRQYAQACEVSNSRLRSLLRLTQFSAMNYYSDETLMRSTFDELSAHMPVEGIALCDVRRQKLLAVARSNGCEVKFTNVDNVGVASGYDYLLAEAEPKLLVQSWVDRNTGLDTSTLASFVYPLVVWNRQICTVGFYLDAGFDGTPSEREFLGMCAHFLAFQWEQAKLLLHVAHHASLGNIAVELARNFIQPLTAIRTAADFVHEVETSPEVIEGMQIVHENVERLRRQTQEFRRLSLHREGCVETVFLDQYINQALDMLTVAIQNRNVIVDRDFQADCECVLLNGTVLARTFLDLILGTLRVVDVGGRISLSLRDVPGDRLAFEIAYTGRGAMFDSAESATHPVSILGSPGLQLAQRTVYSCGGTLSTELDGEGRTVLRILLPRNITVPSVMGEVNH